MKAGAFTPPQSTERALCPFDEQSLNEGGGFHPRNPGDQRAAPAQVSVRSMKAGAFTPAIQAKMLRESLEQNGAQ